MTDLEIAQKAQMLPIKEVAKKLNISEDDLDPYGKYKAKLPLHLINAEKMKNSKLVLVTAITPTPAGEGKTTVSIGLTEGLNKIGKKAIAVLREPSLGPVFGIKGGAAGGGYSQVVPMEDINLHFTGDHSAVIRCGDVSRLQPVKSGAPAANPASRQMAHRTLSFPPQVHPAQRTQGQTAHHRPERRTRLLRPREY